MFATIKKSIYKKILGEETYAEARALGYAEGLAEAGATKWQAWWQRRTATGSFVPDDNDPPPDQHKTDR